MKNYQRNLYTALALGTLVALSGCGKQEFIVATATLEQGAPGFFTVPPRVDILLAQDDSGSQLESLSSVSAETQNFLSQLESMGWDYHFAVSPLTTNRPISQALAARYDVNWGDQWKAPFPGASKDTSGMLTPSVFRFPSAFTGFLTSNDMHPSAGSSEPGLRNTLSTLALEAMNPDVTGFLRQDALLAVIAYSNGEDTSDVNLSNYPAVNWDENLDYYANNFKALKPSASQVKFYADISQSPDGSSTFNCRSGIARKGYRYTQMAGRLGGKAYNNCTQNIGSVLSDIASQLQTVKLALRVRYLMLGQAPDENSVHVTKYLNGDRSQAIDIPHDATNGWTYAGYLKDVATVDSPAPLNKATGYAIELHGTAKLIGNDTAYIDFKPAGAQNSASK